MAPKPHRKASEDSQAAIKHRKGFRVGPDNLPDGPWRRKVTKIKKDLIHKAKVKKAYAKIKQREQHSGSLANEANENAGQDQYDEAAMHPTRELMIKDEAVAQASVTKTGGEGESNSDGLRRRTRRPGYYDKQLAKADDRRNEAERRAAEREARMAERAERMAEREKFKRAMAKTVGRDGKKKLGRESVLLLDKVKRAMAGK